jgi:hypothetical protein
MESSLLSLIDRIPFRGNGYDGHFCLTRLQRLHTEVSAMFCMHCFGNAIPARLKGRELASGHS